MRIPPGTSIGRVHLRVGDLDRSLAFYTRVLGFHLLSRGDADATLGVPGTPLLVLTASPGLEPRPRRSTGLYHFAVLVPDRGALGQALLRLAAARWPLQGASDHAVSEALYLADPDGIGIEIYRDRPRDDWPMAGDRVEMVTEPLDLEPILTAAQQDTRDASRLPAGTTMGHVHLQVRDVPEADAFFRGALGFDVMQYMAPSALFVSAGGYHHHIGLNTWGTQGAPPQPVNTPGLEYFTVRLPDAAAVQDLRHALATAGIPMETRHDGTLVRDPSGNGVLLTALQ